MMVWKKKATVSVNDLLYWCIL